MRALPTSAVSTHPVLDDITVVIPTLGRSILEQCLSWLVAGDAWPGEVIVVDQSSSPQVAQWLASVGERGINARYIPSSQRGRSAGINRGLEKVTTRFVAVTDDDCFVERDWLQAMVSHLRAQPERIITGRVEPAGDDEFCVVTSRTPAVYYRPALKVHPLIGGNMGVPMANAERIGPFDEDPCVASAEDSDWGYRALRLGIPIVYAPEVVLRHYSWRDPTQRSHRYRQYSRSQGGFYGKYLLSGDLLIPIQTCRALIRGPVRWLRGVVKADDDLIARGKADTLELPRGIIAGLRLRGGH